MPNSIHRRRVYTPIKVDDGVMSSGEVDGVHDTEGVVSTSQDAKISAKAYAIGVSKNQRNVYLERNRIREFRERMGFTTKMLATEIGVNTTYLWELETSDMVPDPRLAALIGNALNVPVCEIWPTLISPSKDNVIRMVVEDANLRQDDNVSLITLDEQFDVLNLAIMDENQPLIEYCLIRISSLSITLLRNILVARKREQGAEYKYYDTDYVLSEMAKLRSFEEPKTES